MGDWADDYGGYDGLDHQHFMEDRANERRAQRAKLLTPPAQNPMHPEIKKMYEDYFDKCFREFSATQPAPVQEPVMVDLATMELAESVGLIGPASRTHDLHNAIQRFHDLICANATIKAAVAFSRTLEAKDEPVAWVCEGFSSDEKHAIDYWQGDVDDLPIGTQLYTTPPAAQRTWVGLTDDEIAYAYTLEKKFAMQYVDAKLKEKNYVF
jgi:hypothetical protein